MKSVFSLGLNSAYLLGLVPEKVRTVSVAFEPNGKTYTYLSLIETLKPGQDVLVEVGYEVRADGKPALKVATVVSVDTEVKVDPTSCIKFRWVVSKLGTGARAKQDELHAFEAHALSRLAKAEKALAKVKKLADSALLTPPQEN